MDKPFKIKENLDNSRPAGAHRFCVAPMMDWSDKHCRYLWRLISKYAFLYTEMVTTGALLHGDSGRFLHYNREEHPVALQLGGSNPKELARCAQLAEQWGYDEVNLNCGCPSDRVQSGRFGACLMAEPALVADCFSAMQSQISIPVSVKHRIGIDDQDEREDLHRFVGAVAEAGCRIFIVHARKAWLQGLSPKENRDVPPLDYERVYQLKQEFPDLEIIINGGITNLACTQEHLQRVDGVMVGREAYNNPFILSEVDQRVYSDLMDSVNHRPATRVEVLTQYADYCRAEIERDTKLSALSRHVMGLFHAQRGGKQFRRFISENAHRENATEEVLLQALALVSGEVKSEG